MARRGVEEGTPEQAVLHGTARARPAGHEDSTLVLAGRDALRGLPRRHRLQRSHDRHPVYSARVEDELRRDSAHRRRVRTVVRGAPDHWRTSRRSLWPPTDVYDRHGGLHHRVRAVRLRPLADCANRIARAAGSLRGSHGATGAVVYRGDIHASRAESRLCDIRYDDRVRHDRGPGAGRPAGQRRLVRARVAAGVSGQPPLWCGRHDPCVAARPGIACAGRPQARSGRGRARVRCPRAALISAHPRRSRGLAGLDLALARRRGRSHGGVRALRALEDGPGRVAAGCALAVPPPIVRGRTGRGPQLLFGARSFLVLLAEYLQSGLDLTPRAAGLRFLPFAIGFLSASFASARLAPRLGRAILQLGAALMVTGLLTLMAVVHSVTLDTSATAYILPLVIYGLGQGTLQAPLVNFILAEVPPDDAGSASGVVTMLQQLSFALGVAVIGSVFAVALGPHPGSSGYGRALDHALVWNIGLLTVTFVAAFALPRRQRVQVTTAG